ncbi:hypothetical protein NSK_004526 [Nannochloropsis salina CCMP1776]|uniref:T-complex protein 1 subunit beta n=1 Tax=Nannochloropsis salina CCMP1776 TaxID=1027361 RepID=A0A4D9CXM0_9STRA|nr:hypothetical protein NSK_004526 [Nannochloropsis salina CCMP1776]|eukprot:TFJ84052.1 hypothetical protein NSK_004526 [Nannochloropsis salina CCMP1776]
MSYAGVLNAGAEVDKGENARMSSFIGAIAIADLVKTTLGPKGMDKILQAVGSSEGAITVSWEGRRAGGRTRGREGEREGGREVSISLAMDMKSLGITESFKSKLQVLISAAEAAEMIIRVDDIIKSAPRERG